MKTRIRLFWKIGIVYLAMLLAVILILDIYVVRALRKEYLEASFSKLESLSHVAQQMPPASSAVQEMAKWSQMMARDARVTIVANDGKVLADSADDPAKMENHKERPEIMEAFFSGSGKAVRYSPSLKKDFVYFAQRYAMDGTPIVVRFSSPVDRLDAGVALFRKRLWSISLVVLIFAGSATLLFFRMISNRIGRLTEFSRRVAEGDFHPMVIDRSQDELSDLSRTLNQTASRLDQTIRHLIEEKNKSAAILAGMEEGVAVIDAERKVIFCNRAFREAVDITNPHWEGRPVMELIRHSDLLSLIKKVPSGNEVIHGEVVVGSVRTRSFAVACAPFCSDSSATGAVLVLHDITEIRRLERARRDFVANVSHEFRTPLTAIRGFAETLLEGGLEDLENRRRFIEIIHNHAIRLERLTEDLLRLSQVEAGKLQIELMPASTLSIIEPCIETTRIKAKQKDLVLEADCAPNLPPILGDATLLQGVLQELMDNAVRYTPAGGKIRVTAESAESNVVISVADTGIGIPKSDQDRIFERFYRTDPARSRESGGTGLGLSIAKHIVEAHGGKITVDSQVGAGSTFRLILPSTK